MQIPPRISVVIATHHRPDLLRRAIASVLAQTVPSEILICADEDSPETAQVAAELLRSQDKFLCRPGARGPAETRNLGIEQARGTWLMLLDDDDSFEKGYFEALVPHLDRQPDSVHYTNYVRLNEVRGETGLCEERKRTKVALNGRPLAHLSVMNFIPLHGMCIPSSIAKLVQFDPDLATHEDWDFILGLRAHAPFRHIDLFGPTYHISQTETRNRRSFMDKLDDILTIYRRHPATTPVGKLQRAHALKQKGVEVDPATL